MASILKVDKLDPQSGTALEIGSSGDTITIPSGATFTQSGTMNASAITAGTIDTARLGSGTASSSTVLYGDQTYKAEPGGGKLLQVVSHQLITSKEISSNAYTGTGLTLTITPADTSNKILIIGSIWFVLLAGSGEAGVSAIDYRLKRNIASAGETLVHTIGDTQGLLSSDTDATPYTEARIDAMASINYIDSPSTTSSTVYSIDFRNITDYSGCNINGAWSGGTGTSHPVSTIHALEIDGT